MDRFGFKRQARMVGRRLLISFLTVFVLVALLSLIVAFFGAQVVRGWATQQIEEHLDRPVEIGAARLTLLPRPRIALEQLVVREHNREDILLRANRLTVVLQLLPLVHLALVPSLVNIEQPQLALRRAPDGQWNVLAPPSGSGASSPTAPWGALWGANAIRVHGGRVTVEDRARRDGIHRVSFDAVELRITPGRSGLGPALHLEVAIPSDQASAHVVLNGHLNRTQGTASMPGFDGSVDAERIDLRQLLAFVGPLPVPEQIHGTGSLRTQVRFVPGPRGDSVTLANLVADVAGLHLEGQASLTAVRNARKRLVLTISSEQMNLSAPTQGATVAGLEAGTLAFTLHTKGVGVADWPAWEITGALALRDGTLRPRGWSAPLTHLDADLRLTPTGTALERAQMTLQDNDLVASGWIARWTPAPDVTLQIVSNQFDLALLRQGSGEGNTWLDTLAGLGRVNAGVHIREATYEGQRVTDLSGQVHVAHNAVTVDDIQGRMGDGRVGARLHLRLPPGEPVDTELALNVARVPTEAMLRVLHVKDSPIVGPLDLTGTLTAHGSLTTLGGHLRLHIERGVIHRLTVLSKLLGILNVPALLRGKVDLFHKGMSFDHITAAMSLKDGRLTSQDLLVDSLVMKISTAGSYDLASDRLDAVSAVSPLGSYTDLLQRIPLFGKVFGDDRSSIVTAVFKVQGPLEDPDVRYLPLRSLKTDVGGLVKRSLDALKHVVLLPLRAVGSGAGDSDQ